MHPEHWWIVNPAGHRAWEASQSIDLPPGFENVTVVNMAALAGDVWVCDLCNSAIELPGIPMLHLSALCRTCWMEEGPENWVGAPGCGCPPCLAAAVILRRRQVSRARWN